MVPKDVRYSVSPDMQFSSLDGVGYVIIQHIENNIAQRMVKGQTLRYTWPRDDEAQYCDEDRMTT